MECFNQVVCRCVGSSLVLVGSSLVLFGRKSLHTASVWEEIYWLLCFSWAGRMCV